MPSPPRPTLPRHWRLAPLALAMAAAGAARAQELPEPTLALKPATELKPLPRGEGAKVLPIILRARELRGRPDLETVAEGEAEFRRGGLVLSADSLRYDHAEDLALARGNVRISRDGNVYSGPELQLHVQRFEGFFLEPSYRFGRTGAGGTARRIDFLDEQRAIASGATYTSCPSDGSGGPAWLLATDRVKMDFEANEGIAENAVLRFYGVPILGAPVLSFPLTDERKSGWLPPSINLDSKSGLQFSIPWYWNIAPNRDATLTPTVSAKRGFGGEAEFRYLEPGFQGKANVHLLPNDRLTGQARHALNLSHEGTLPLGASFSFNGLRVSDDAYWKDFPRAVPSITPRLLLADLAARRDFNGWISYARVHRWQVLQDDASRIESPYDRAPQVGVRGLQRFGGFEFALETELNRFTEPDNGRADLLAEARPTGLRWHALGSIARPFGSPGWTVTPRASFNAAAYSLDEPLGGRRGLSRVIPTLSVDSHWQLERDASWFGRDVRQTLEPRLMVVSTPYRAQDARLAFDTAPRDFNFESLYAENAFSGVDRVSDAQQLTAGVTTRFLDPASGAEALRLGVAQRYLFRDQRITTDCTAPIDPLLPPECTPLTQRFSDLLLFGSTTISRRWTFDGSLQYSPDLKRTVRSILGARYSPGPYRTFGLTYRLARGLSEQVELGWQWPIYGRTPLEAAAGGSAGGADCKGSWYSVGRVNYSMRDSRITDSVLGFEYDAGCWIGRVVAERLSTGRSEATTRLLLQLELVGLSRLGSNPLQVLKDNIPGYRLLRDERGTPAVTTSYD
ncbi:MAG: LPS-assembly protein LptD [Piscinibacter sp.]